MMLLGGLLSVAQLGLLLALFYHYFLLLAGARTPRLPREVTGSKHRFALIVPAHDEAAVIGATVANLRQLEYPADLFDVVVVADHCRDETAELAELAGARTFRRFDGPRGRKGYALAWLLEQLLDDLSDYEAFVVLDADSRVNPDFLQALNDGLNVGFHALQGCHIIANPERSLYNNLAAVDLRLNNRMRNAARHNLGTSARLMGDAMCFTAHLLRQIPWRTFSLVEDVEYGVELLLRGVRIGYVPEAVSYGQAAGNWEKARRQRVRWEGGFHDLRRRLPLRLLAESWRQRRLDLLDRSLELLLPPFSSLALISAIMLLLQYVWRGPRLLLSGRLALLMVAGWGAFPFIGLALDQAPLSLFRGLVYGPIYILWRVWISVYTAVRGDKVRWVRTPREEEQQ